MPAATPNEPSDAEQQRLLQVEVEFAKAERLTFFSDAVAAIAITLLALDLPVPTGDVDIFRFASDHIEDYAAFLISFAVIGAHWVGHHHVFGYLNRIGGRLLRYNMLWLLLIVVTPFATRVLTGDTAFVPRFAFYALVQALQSTLFVLMVYEMDRLGLTRAGTPAEMFTRSYWRSGVIATGFAVSIPLSLLIGRWAFVCWFVVPVGTQRLRKLYAWRKTRSLTSG